ncbi:MAG: HD domain-containing protein, partial [Spirochaetaceae bacterium]|nr:HD domain-containing protein [Spirochaetaceae bacterium]
MNRNRESRESKLQRIIETEKILNEIQDVDILLERILTEARAILNADAGSIYVCEGDIVKIRYAQNDTQQRRLLPGQKMVYSFFSFPITKKSIVGYSILSGKLVNEPDVYSISPDKPYTSNLQTDIITGYKTHSNLTIPLATASGKILGALQMLNAQDEQGKVIPFDQDAELYINHFASSATYALERAHLTRAMILRMIQMAEFRDPKETGVHVNRVANYAMEIYDYWAFNHKIGQDEFHKYRDALRIAAMLHDVGKVGISDIILKKAARFTNEEFKIMQTHTWIGGKLFEDTASPVDVMARDVALSHHENWDGTGYPGHIDYPTGESLKVDP